MFLSCLHLQNAILSAEIPTRLWIFNVIEFLSPGANFHHGQVISQRALWHLPTAIRQCFPAEHGDLCVLCAVITTLCAFGTLDNRVLEIHGQCSCFWCSQFCKTVGVLLAWRRFCEVVYGSMRLLCKAAERVWIRFCEVIESPQRLKKFLWHCRRSYKVVDCSVSL